MKAKTFIISFLMMFCSYAFGQTQSPWGSVDGNAQENNMNVIAQIYIDNDMLGNNYEIGAFCGNEFRGSARPNDSQFKLVFLTIYGKNGDKISYKLYDHSRGQELDFFITDAETFGANTVIGSIENLTDGKIEHKYTFSSVAKVNDVKYGTFEGAYAAAEDDDVLTLLQDIEFSNIFVLDKAITFDGNNHTIASTASRAINVSKDATIKNLTVTTTGERAIQPIAEIELTLDNVKATASNYAINLPQDASGSEIIIKNSELTGLATLNIWSNDIEATVENTTFNCNDNAANEQYGAITISGGTNVKVTADNSVFNVKGDSFGGLVHTEDGDIEITNSTGNTEVKYVVAKIGNAGYFTLADAIEAAKTGETITLVRDITSSSIITIDKAITLDGNNNTLTSKAGRAINVSGADGVTIQNLTIDAKGERAINIIQNATNVTIDKVTATAKNYTVNVASSAPNAIVKIKNSTLNGLCTVNVSAAGANVTVENSTVNCNDNNTTAGESYAALSLNKEAVGGSIVATNSTVNVTEGSDSHKGRNGAEDGTVTGTDDVITIVAVITYPNNNYYYSFETLASAIEFAEENDVVTIIRNTAGAGVSINKDVTIDFNGKTYTINEAAGSKGTKSQGFQLLPEAENVTIKNGTIKVAEGTNVVWMFNDYAQNLTVKDLTIDCKNMVWTKSVYLLVANNEHGTNPKPVFSNVKIENYDVTKRPHVLLENNTQLTAQAGLTVVTDPGFVVVYKNGVYSVNTAVARIGETYYNTFAEALEAVQNNDVIELFDVVGDESKTEIDFSKKITFSIKGNAPKYALPVVTFTNAKINIDGSTILIPELDARQNATINVNNSTVYSAGGDGIVKSYYNGTINIDKTSTVYTMQVTTMGYITVAGTLNATWQTNVYGNGLITLNEGAQFNTAALHLTAKEYSGRDNTDAGRKDKPAEIIVNEGANFVVGKVYSSNGADYSYNSSKGINIGTVAGKSAVLTLLNGGNVEIYMANGEKVNIGAGGKVEVGASTMKTFCRAENGTVGIDNNGTINFSDVTSELHITQEVLNITTSVPGYAVKYVDGVYKLVANLVVNTSTNVTYPSLSSAIAAATVGNTIQFLGNITENVTINKNLTIDGAGKNYTGTMNLTKVNVTIENVNFVKGNISKAKSAANGGDYTIKNCTFDGQGLNSYAVNLHKTNNIVIENVTAKNYGYGFLQLPSSNISLSVKNVNISNVNYGLKIDYSNGVTLENVTTTNVKNYGIYDSNYGTKTYTVKDCDLSSIEIWERENKVSVSTFNFIGGNTVSTLENSQYAKYVLGAKDATLTAPQGSTVTTTVDKCVVKWENGVYSVKDAIAAIGNEYFASIQDAIDAAEDNETVVLLQNVTLADKDIFTAGDLKVMINVEGKDITLDLNEKTIELDYNGSSYSDLMTVVLVADGASLTVEGNGTINFEENSRNCGYLFFKRGYNGNLTINNGSFRIYDPEDSMIYTHDGNDVTINGGNFVVDLTGTRANGCPWIFNTRGNNETGVTVMGGTFNADINHQYWAFEVKVSEKLALRSNSDGTWTVVPAEAYVVEKSGNNNRKVGYVTLTEAFAVAMDKNYTTVGLSKDITTDKVYTIKAGETVTFDLNGKTLQGTDNTTKNFGLIQNNGTLTVNATDGGSMLLTATVNSGWGRYSAVISNNPGATLTVNGGTIEHHGGTDMAYGIDALTNGGIGDVNTTINGGTIKSTYRAVRQFLNSDSKENNLTVNGGTLEGANKSIFFHDPSTKANNGTVTVSANAVLNGDVYLYVTAGSTEWPVEVSIANAAFKNGTVITVNVPKTYTVDQVNKIWTVLRVSEQTLISGWNWFSHFVEGETESSILEQLISQTGENLLQVKSANSAYDPSWGGDLETTSVTEMYKIETNAEVKLNIVGNLVNPANYPITLNGNDKWSYIGYPLNVAQKISDVFTSATNGDVVKTRTGFATYNEALNMWFGLESMEPGIGYMYLSKKPTDYTFTYSYPQSKASVEANITAENNYWVPTSQYANNMTMVAMLDVKGDNYEVAAFVNGEVRGSARPIYIEQLDAYMFFLTIQGENVEEMTFKCYDIDTDTEYTLGNVMNYSNDAMVGSIDEPYLLSRGILGLEEVSSFNIYPNPTTTDREINLSTTCDKVEVFNALGVKVAEYQNVDTIDAFETAGIYVIRVTNNGNVKHCRLVVK